MQELIEIDGKLYWFWKTEGTYDYYICYDDGDVILIPNAIETIDKK